MATNLTDEESTNSSFASWVRKNGGDEEISQILADHGFTSQLSLSFVDTKSPECESMLACMNYGQRCLFQGLVRLASASGRDQYVGSSKASVYGGALDKAEKVAGVGKKVGLRQRIGQLFFPSRPSNNGTSPGPSTTSESCDIQQGGSSSDEFQPPPMYQGSSCKGRVKRQKTGGGSSQLQKGKGKGPMSGSRSGKRKVREVRLKVVGLREAVSRTPSGKEREKLTQDVWVRVDASEESVHKKIREAFAWDQSSTIKYMYVQGKCMRPASLDDIENADSWDFESVRALMGNGCLYAVQENKPVELLSTSSSEPELPAVPFKFESDVQRLMEMFPSESREHVAGVLKLHGMAGALDLLLQTKPTTSSLQTPEVCTSHQPNAVTPSHDDFDDLETMPSPTSKSLVSVGEGSSMPNIYDGVTTLEGLLRKHSDHVIDQRSEYILSIDRTCKDHFWKMVEAFYKGGISRPHKLQKVLVIQFEGEVGADGGALRKEFFEDALKDMNDRLFEGTPDQRIPKKDWDLQWAMEIAGMLIGHSVLQEGPAFGCVSPTVFDFLVTGDSSMCFPTKADIPLNLTTCDLLTFIDKIDRAETDEAIDHILDEPGGLFVVNNSGWNHTEAITVQNKTRLLQYLIWDEVINKRKDHLTALRRGMEWVDFLELVTTYPHLTKPLLVYTQCDKLLDANLFRSLVCSARPPENVKGLLPQDKEEEEKKVVVYDWFMEFIDILEGNAQTESPQLTHLLRFITGESDIPPMGLNYPIEILYLPPSPTASLPCAQCCFSKLYLPVVYNTKDAFIQAMLKALQFGGGFGNS